ncbi:Phage tail tube protein [Anaerovirgula multivorans]|uniref:Phage tail tube protein n=1 Tax=Anaerovirgula multivorans TaxID=312168 RepID=A0A238ZT02_9FIRM|nr:phage tail tube protein [Anaerovirgula multivorans]SNR86048.1 Phage tail tube protein [Anaerovirgula multivorans]
MDVKNVINGSYGSVWVDNELWGEVDSFSATVNIDYEDVNIAGSLATHKKQTGWNGTGSMTVKKVNSRVAKKAANAVKNGIVPRMKVVGKLADPDALGVERVALYDVTFDSFILMNFEQKTTITNEIPFAFSDYDLVDTI